MAPATPAALERPHFIGIGGAGHVGHRADPRPARGQVAGSDARESETVASLRALGATVHIGHAAHHLADDASSVVVSSAIRPDNPELARAAELGIPVVHRSDALAACMKDRRAIAVAGTHGKTTTTSMLAVALTELGLDPSYAIGGDLAGPGTNARHGDGEVFVAGADESDRSFQKYDPEVALVLNVELDHHANYASMEEIYESFEAFAAKIRPGGTLVVGEHGGAREPPPASARARHRAHPRDPHRRRVRGLRRPHPRHHPQGMTSEVTVALDGAEHTFTVSVPGRHYAHNAAAALAAGAAPASTRPPRPGPHRLHRCRPPPPAQGRGRRGQVIDSYAHHPTEMTADLEAMRAAAGPAAASQSSSSPTSSPAPRNWAPRWGRPWPSRTRRWSSTSTRPARTRSPASRAPSSPTRRPPQAPTSRRSTTRTRSRS